MSSDDKPGDVRRSLTPMTPERIARAAARAVADPYPQPAPASHTGGHHKHKPATLFDLIRGEGYTPIIHPQPHLHPDALGAPNDDSGVAVCKGNILRLTSDSWDMAYSAAHEIAEDYCGFTGHNEFLFVFQANMLARWCSEGRQAA